MKYISDTLKALSRLLPVLALATLASCDSFIYEDEGD